MKDDKTSLKISSTKESGPVVENGKKRTRPVRPASKLVVRLLPPTMTEEQFKMQVSPLPDLDYFYFVPADMSLAPNAYCRAYLNFIDQSDLLIFTEKFDGYVFVDGKGDEFPAVVEYAPFQRIPKIRPNRKKDPKMGTIEDHPAFIAFKEQMEAENLENKAAANTSKQHFFETSLLPETKEEVISTPLLEYIRNKRAERQKMRDEKREEKRKKDLERRKTKEEQKKVKKDEDSVVVKVLNTPTVSKESSKEKETKQSGTKKKLEEVKHILKEKSVHESRSKDSKQRTGKSYLEERQRQAERREEHRKKLSQSQSSDNLSEYKSKAESVDKYGMDEEQEKSTTVDSETKEVEFKKERIFKKEEIKKNSYKYSSSRDKEADESRKTRRTNSLKTYSTNKKEYDKPEDRGRKRYSESRKNQDSIHRDRYKDKDKTKLFSIKKSSSAIADIDKTRIISNDTVKASGSSDSNKIMINVNTENTYVPDKELIETNSVSRSIDTKRDLNEKAEDKLFETKDKINRTRRKSLDYDKNRYSTNCTSSKGYAKENYTEKKRRNSVGSNNPIKGSEEVSYFENDKNHSKNAIIKSLSKENLLTDNTFLDNIPSKPGNHRNVCDKENLKDDSEDTNKVKRRNSTGETQESRVKEPSRRNSFGSEYNSNSCIFTEQKVSSKVTTKKDKTKYEKKIQQSSQDPRTERRIRNKDRPSIEIYRPGMGKFSKQRLERGKVLGSSTEVDSPSSSPSPTPVLKHKTLANH